MTCNTSPVAASRSPAAPALLQAPQCEPAYRRRRNVYSSAPPGRPCSRSASYPAPPTGHPGDHISFFSLFGRASGSLSRTRRSGSFVSPYPDKVSAPLSVEPRAYAGQELRPLSAQPCRRPRSSEGQESTPISAVSCSCRERSFGQSEKTTAELCGQPAPPVSTGSGRLRAPVVALGEISRRPPGTARYT